MVTDAIVLCLPLPVVWSLNTGINKKIGLSFAFALGGFTCIASIIRMAILPQLNPMDITCMCGWSESYAISKTVTDNQ